jgi:hypothetical protein
MKKRLLSFILIFYSLSVFSQDTIYLKNGTKIIPDPNVHKYYGTPLTNIIDGKKVEYFPLDSRWGKILKSKAINYAVIGDRLIKVFELKYNDKGKEKISEPLAFYVFIETEEYILLNVTYSKDYIVPVVQFIVIDKNHVILDRVTYVGGGTKKDFQKREEVVEMIKKYFSNIKEEMDFLDECRVKSKDYDYTGISEYVNIHTYKKY